MREQGIFPAGNEGFLWACMLGTSVFDIMVAFVVVILKKLFYKNTFSWGWFDIYICFVKTVVKIEVEQKIV